MRLKSIIFAVSATMLISGCATKQDRISLDQVDFSKSQKADMSTFEVQLLRVATKAEQHWKDYYSLLEKRKNLYDEKLHLHVPAGMGKIIDAEFEGYAGTFLTQLGEQAGYNVIFQDMLADSTPMIAVKYHRTTIWDIVQITMAKMPGHDIKIVENDRVINVYPKH